MTTADDLLKSLIDNFTLDFATWLLNTPIQSVAPLNLELPAQPKTFVDRVFLVTTATQQEVNLHVEFQGRRSRVPVPERMLEYQTRFSQLSKTPTCSVVIYIGRWAGSKDDGHHQQTCPLTGLTILEWRYQVIRLWQLPAEQLLALKKIPLLALVGLTKIDKPEETIPDVVAKIRSLPELTSRQQLFTILISLTENEEIIAMIENLLEPEEELLIDTPFLRRMRDIGRREGRAEGRTEGRAEGRLEGEAQLLERQLRQRFGELPSWALSRLRQARPEQLEAWSLRVLDAPRLERVFEE